MCGICGKIVLDQRPIAEAFIRNMCNSSFYRGPDDNGIFLKNQNSSSAQKVNVGLGHTRLSVVDLSSAGRQPMCNEDGKIWITYNGEIYNYRKIKAGLERQGHVFKSDTDTEVILHLYEEQGLEAVQHLNGMFAFALWDEKLGRLWVCRDRIGIKPLVYYWDGQAFVFASEIKALLQDFNISKELDDEALWLYLAFNYVPAPYTIFKHIRKLEPGHYLNLEGGNLETRKYWEPPAQIDTDTSSRRIAEQKSIYKKRLYEVLNDSVSDRMIADVPLGAFLSGGIDSSIIVALMARHSDKSVKTFSIGFKNDKFFDETRYARQVAELYQTKHHEFKLDHQDLLDVLSEVLSAFDEPFADSSAIPAYIISRETRGYVTVALSGDGGDELFAGYRSYLGEYWYARYMLIPGLLREWVVEKLIQALPDSRDSRIMEYIRRMKRFVKGTKGSFGQRLLALKEVFPADIRQQLLSHSRRSRADRTEDPALEHVHRFLDFYQGDCLNRILYYDFKDSLPGDMLTKVDWMSMRNSLEVRVPFLDHRVVELAFTMPGNLKLRKGKGKYILRETFKDLLPPDLHRRSKAGFEIPISRWLRNDLKFLIDKYLAEERIKDQRFFDYEVIRGLVQDHQTARTDTSWMLWNLIVFQYWYENYFL